MSEEKRLRTVKTEKKKARDFKAFVVDNIKNFIIGAIVLLVLFIAYLGSPLSKTSQINVSGINDLGEQQVINASKISTDTSVLNVFSHKRTYEQRVKDDLQTIKTINFDIDSFNKLDIKIKEYETVGFILKDGHYYRILETGKTVSKKLKLPIGNYPVYSGFDNKDVLDNTIKQYAKLDLKIKNSISEVKYEPAKLDKNKVRLYMNDGNEVIVNTKTMVKKMKYYPSISSQMKEKGVVDLEVGSFSYPFSSK
ncbi:cell division protein DivIB [Companilactobacillus sp. RD055328]|uniref:cell division protein FtsQ/DivIB n=1 Tax=Companilactobacillus sp. RD055328 TaxID=2916634 RepID=UPI001FC805FA|nr:cell division protein FtsQ/DivIB [Companilactobacillus sp. RD055328]GKQ42848.1 cell division protein DivIB [Companilactobacillus sp. RD055328]